jgi:hypothetical protein
MYTKYLMLIKLMSNYIYSHSYTETHTKRLFMIIDSYYTRQLTKCGTIIPKV